MSSPEPLFVKLKQGDAPAGEMRFTGTFKIGRGKECDLQIKDKHVSRNHVEVIFDGKNWWVKDLGSFNGTFLNGSRISKVELEGKAELELGKGGPVFLLRTEEERYPETEEEMTHSTEEFTSATQIMRRYFNKPLSEKTGEHTMMFKHAFERAHKKRSRKYLAVIAAGLCLLLASGSIIIYQKNKLIKLRETAVDIFYTMKSLELQIAELEEIVLSSANRDQIRKLLSKRAQLGKMENDYDNFVKELGIFAKIPEEQRIILRIARLFGECEVNAPEGFVKEVWRYINKWKSTERLRKAIDRAKSKDYAPAVTQAMTGNDLPPHFFYLAVQESGFNARAVGPKTKYGYAKGIWQFIPATASEYGLKIGPLYKKRLYDAKDERFNFTKATRAAAGYLKDINNTEAQASGLLVMASYNWGETKIRRIIRRMPENPRERNFWRLLESGKIPRETYDYVFYIFSSAVICENPPLFGFDFDCPMLQ